MRRPRRLSVGLALVLPILAGSSSSPARADDPPQARSKAPAAADPVRDELLKINYVFNRELYDLAIPRYAKLLEANPGYARADLIRYGLALSHYNLATRAPRGAGAEPVAGGGLEHLREAVTHLKEALRSKEFESRVEATRILAQSYLLLGETDLAAKAFQWVLDKHGKSKEAPAAAIGLAECAGARGEPGRAAELYRAALERELTAEEAARVRYQLALSLYRAGSVPEASSDPQAARRDLEEVASVLEPLLRAAPGQPARSADDARQLLALTREAMGDLDGAVGAYRQLAASGGEGAKELASLGIASALFRAGRHKEAIAELESFAASFPKSLRRDEASLLLGRALADSGKAAQGAKLLGDLRDQEKVGEEASLWLAKIYSRHQKPKSAITVLTTALKRFPRGPLRGDLELELAAAHIAAGSFDAASELLSRLEADDDKASPPAPGSAPRDQVAYLRAFALHRSKQYAESSAACARLLESFPQSRLLKDATLLEAENKLLGGDPEAAFPLYGAYLERFKEQLSGTDRLKAAFRTGHALYLAKKYAEASERLAGLDPAQYGSEAERAAREDPFFGAWRYLVADCAYQQKEYARAREGFVAFLAELSAAAESPRTAALALEASDARFKLGHALELEGSLEPARDAFQKALEADPKSAHQEQILFELGQIAYRLKDPASARRSLEQLLEGDPASRFAPPALRLLGWIATEAKDFAGAEERFGALQRDFPDHALAAEAHFQWALSLQAQGKAGEARAALESFKAKHPGDPRLSRVLLEEASTLARAGKHAEALEALERIRAAAGPELLPSILYEEAWCHRGLGKLDEAARAYTDILAIEGAGLADTARLELGELELERQQYARAREALAPLGEKAGAQQEKALYRLAWCHHYLDEPAAVVALHERFSRSFAASPLAGEVALLGARAYLKQGQHDRAGEVFRALAEASPGTAEGELARVSQGECLAEARKYGAAEALFAEFLKQHPQSPHAPRATFGRAWCFENLDRRDEAMPLYRAVAVASKTEAAARAQFQLGQCHAARREYQDAIVELLQVSAGFNFPEWSSKALLQVAGCFETLEDLEKARKYYEEVVATFPDRDEARLARERLAKLENR